MDRNMTQGSIARTLLRFSIPLALSGLLQQLYSWCDALIVGNFVGEDALAAIGATGTISGLFISLILGFTVGVSIVVAQAYGAADTKMVTDVTATFVTLLTTAAVLLAAVGAALAWPLLALLHTPADILSQSAAYLRILFAGLPALAIYNTYYAALRGIGDSRTPLLAIIVSSIANLLLDLLLVAVIPLGVAGAAIATALSQWMMAVFLILYAPRRHPLMWFGPRFRPDPAVVRRGFSLGVPTSAQSMLRSVGALLLANVMNGFGTTTVAAITPAYRIDSLTLLPLTNVAAGVSTFVAQNKGAGDMGRARRGLRAGLALSVASSIATTTVVVLLGEALMRLFGITDAAVAIGGDFLRFCAVFYPIFGIQHAFIGYLQGVGDVRFTALATISSLALRVALSYALRGAVGNRVIAYAEMVSWVYCATICAARYVAVRNRREDSPLKPGASA